MPPGLSPGTFCASCCMRHWRSDTADNLVLYYEQARRTWCSPEGDAPVGVC